MSVKNRPTPGHRSARLDAQSFVDYGDRVGELPAEVVGTTRFAFTGC